MVDAFLDFLQFFGHKRFCFQKDYNTLSKDATMWYIVGMDIKYDETKLKEAANSFGLKFVILHGSFAKGLPHKYSDLDIAVLGEPALDFEKELKLYGAMSEVFKLPAQTDLDFKTLNKVDPLFRYQVIKDGKLLYGNPTDYEDYKAYSYRAYEDARPLFELERLLVYKFQKYLNARYVRQSKIN